MQWTNEEKQEWLDYVIQHNYNRIEQAAKRLGQKGGQFSMNITLILWMLLENQLDS